jgi:glycosyltransferase involved in cell wall biosynthesis
MEAMVAGVPVIATRVGGIPDIVADGQSGLLVPPGDVQALGQAMHQLLSNPDLRQQMSVAARQRVTAFQSQSVVARIEGIYQKLCQP